MKTSKKLSEISQNTELIPVFQDEVHFQAQTTITRIWAERGSEPKVMPKPGKDKIAYSGFIIPKTGELVVTKPGWFNYEPVIESLSDFCQAKPCPEGKNTASSETMLPGTKKPFGSSGKNSWKNMLISVKRWNAFPFLRILLT